MRKAALFLLCVFVFTIPWEDMFPIPGFGTLSRIVGALAFAATLFLVVYTGKLRSPGLSHLLMTLFVVFAALSYTWTVDAELTATQVLTYLQLLVMVWVIWELPRVNTEYANLMKAFIFGAYIASLGTIAAYLFGPATDSGRYAAAGFDPNALGVTLAIGIPMAWYLALQYKHGLVLWLYRLYVPTAVLSILLTASRGAFFATLAALIVIPLTAENKRVARRQVAFMLATITVVVLGVSIVSPASWQRLLTSGQELTDGTLNSRTLIWQAGFYNFRQSPLLGVGSGAFKSSVSSLFTRDYVVHNVFLSVLFEQGIIGTIIFVSLLVALGLGIRKIPRIEQRLWSVLGLVWSIGGLTLTMEPRKITWLLWGLLAAHSNSGFRRTGEPLEMDLATSKS